MTEKLPKNPLWDEIARTQGQSFADHIAWASLVSALIEKGTLDGKELLKNLQSSIDAVERMKEARATVAGGVAERLQDCAGMVQALLDAKVNK